MKKEILLAFIGFCFALPLFADTGVLGGAFLRQMISAKEQALAGAAAADIPEISSGAYNPAGLVLFSERQVSANYSRLFGDINLGTVAYLQPLHKGAMTGNFVVWGMDTFTQFDSNGIDLGNKLAYSGFGLTAGMGQFIKGDLSIGLKAKFFSERLMEENHTLIACDLGAMNEFHFRLFGDRQLKDLDVGLTVQNLGVILKNKGKSEITPLCFRAGARYNAYKIPDNTVFVMTDIRDYLGENPDFIFSLEWLTMKMLYIRAGYCLELEKNLNTYSAGLGIKYPVRKNLILKLDYAIAPMEDLGYEHFATLSFIF